MYPRFLRKKKLVGEKCSIPLPVPISTITNLPCKNTTWNYFTGDFVDGRVIVECEGDQNSLYSMGCFGKISVANLENGNLEDGDHPVSVLPSSSDSLSRVNPTCLCLSLEEAFFLSYGLGCLFIRSGSKELVIQEQWTTFCSLMGSFPYRYAAYHHFRIKGWVPREGVKYGTDFVLYKQGPSYYHASYAVAIIQSNEDTKYSWHTLAGLGRLVSSASKELLLCYVRSPKTDITFDTPECIKHMKIHEIVMNRWVSTKEKEHEERDIDSTS